MAEMDDKNLPDVPSGTSEAGTPTGGDATAAREPEAYPVPRWKTEKPFEAMREEAENDAASGTEATGEHAAKEETVADEVEADVEDLTDVEDSDRAEPPAESEDAQEQEDGIETDLADAESDPLGREDESGTVPFGSLEGVFIETVDTEVEELPEEQPEAETETPPRERPEADDTDVETTEDVPKTEETEVEPTGPPWIQEADQQGHEVLLVSPDTPGQPQAPYDQLSLQETPNADWTRSVETQERLRELLMNDDVDSEDDLLDDNDL